MLSSLYWFVDLLKELDKTMELNVCCVCCNYREWAKKKPLILEQIMIKRRIQEFDECKGDWQALGGGRGCLLVS